MAKRKGKICRNSVKGLLLLDNTYMLDYFKNMIKENDSIPELKNLENEISALVFIFLKERTPFETYTSVSFLINSIVEKQIKERINPKA